MFCFSNHCNPLRMRRRNRGVRRPRHKATRGPEGDVSVVFPFTGHRGTGASRGGRHHGAAGTRGRLPGTRPRAPVAHPRVSRQPREEARAVAPEAARRVPGARGAVAVRARRGAAALVRVTGEHHRVPRRGGGRARAPARGVARGSRGARARREARGDAGHQAGPRGHPRRAGDHLGPGLAAVRAALLAGGGGGHQHAEALGFVRARVCRESHQRDGRRAGLVVARTRLRAYRGARRGPRQDIQRQVPEVGAQAQGGGGARDVQNQGAGGAQGPRGAP